MCTVADKAKSAEDATRSERQSAQGARRRPDIEDSGVARIETSQPVGPQKSQSQP
jgi:hypothetical protein